MNGFRRLLAASVATFGLLTSAQTVVAAETPIHFADLNWESGSLITDVLRIIVEKGYGLPTDTLPGTTITLETALANNDIQVIGEEWAGRSPVWVKAEAEGKVVSVGDTVKGATEGWWVPEYVIKGDPAKGIKPLAPDLRSVSDLKKYKDVFKDPENPSKGRFLNSPIGWTSEVVNKQKLTAYGCRTTSPISAVAPARHWTRRSVLRSAAANRCCSTTGRRRRCWANSNWCSWKNPRSMPKPGRP
jgi:glycine betaine/proline transport system substrate-binding protein